MFGGLAGHVVDDAVERPSQLVGGQEIHASVADERRAVGDGVEDPLQARVRRPGGRIATACRARDGASRVGQVEQVGAFGVLEQQGSRERVEHLGGDTVDRAALDAGVVLHAHPGQDGDFGAPQPGHAAVGAPGETNGFGGDAGAARGQELPHVGSVDHPLTLGGGVARRQTPAVPLRCPRPAVPAARAD